jgi:SRSO17 transposase
MEIGHWWLYYDNMSKLVLSTKHLFDPNRWGLPDEAVAQLADALYCFWQRFRPCFRTRTRDTTTNAYIYMQGLLTMEDQRNFANIERRLKGGDGQALQQFMSDSPWSGQAVFRQIQTEIRSHPALQSGGVLILDESADEKAGLNSAGAGRQHNGRLGKVDICQVTTALTYAHPATGTWALVDGELFLPQDWFSPDDAQKRQQLGIPETRQFATKVQLGLEMIKRVHTQGLPFEFVSCDELYGRNRAFRADLDEQGIEYAAQVPIDTAVYVEPVQVSIVRRRRRHGRRRTRLSVVSGQKPQQIRTLAQSSHVVWQHVVVRQSERGVLEAEFAVMRVWTLTDKMQVRAEWVVMRRDGDGKLSCVLLNGSEDKPVMELIERSCQRYFAERVYEDAKSELGWDDFQAQKYLAWEHQLALTAAALWFVAEVKLNWGERYTRDPELVSQLEVEVLPALSTANVRELLQAVLPVPQLSRDQARQLVVRHLVNRARSTSSRLKTQREHNDSS